jgi:hypothetical protein
LGKNQVKLKAGLIKETSSIIWCVEKNVADLNPRGSVLVTMYGANIGEVVSLILETLQIKLLVIHFH